ncbi:uncharacterized protein LOC131363587 [Hemibagrus wyckioides]|uniref:uncharacterized protein LOC131363587 n=1 Tax=Hemibagrus wyckioides TaxID=337641 RepID=UPI00266BDFA5|nr:uncharacterized protein LOC131363587 [Hemibagrus wyckioides]
MESYEEFCLKSLAHVHAESGCSARHGHAEARSAIRFHGRHALLPRLSEQQRVEMAEQRQTAVQRECERHTVRLRSLLDRVQDVIKHVQLQKVQGDEQGDEQGNEQGVNQTVEAPWSKRTQLEEQQHSSHFLNRTALRKKTLLLLNSQMERMRKGGEEKGEEEIQPSCIGEIGIGNEDLGYAEMKSGKKKEKEEPDFDGDCSTDADSRSPDLSLTGFSICSSIMDSYIPLPSPPKPHSCQMPISVSVNKSDVHPHHFNETFKNSKRGATISTEQSSLSASSAVDWNCRCSDLSKTSCNLIISSTPRSLTSQRPISMLNTTQPGLLKIKKTQGNHSATHKRFPLAPLNQSYDVESPSPTLDHLRPQIRSASEASTFIRHSLELGRLPKHRMKQEDVAAADILQNEAVGNIQLEETSCERVKEQHTLQLSDIPKTQEQETRQFQEQQKAACCLTAAARGFLTRQLLRTEKMKQLNKTIQDSREVIRFFQTDTHQRRASFFMQDLKLQHRVRAQVHAAVCEIHEIFFVWPVRDRIALLQQDRKLHSERRVKKKEKAKREQNTPRQSSCTQNALCRMRQRVLQPAQSQNTPIISRTLKPAKAMRKTTAFRAPQPPS